MLAALCGLAVLLVARAHDEETEDLDLDDQHGFTTMSDEINSDPQAIRIRFGRLGGFGGYGGYGYRPFGLTGGLFGGYRPFGGFYGGYGRRFFDDDDKEDSVEKGEDMDINSTPEMDPARLLDDVHHDDDSTKPLADPQGPGGVRIRINIPGRYGYRRGYGYGRYYDDTHSDGNEDIHNVDDDMMELDPQGGGGFGEGGGFGRRRGFRRRGDRRRGDRRRGDRRRGGGRRRGGFRGEEERGGEEERDHDIHDDLMLDELLDPQGGGRYGGYEGMYGGMYGGRGYGGRGYGGRGYGGRGYGGRGYGGRGYGGRGYGGRGYGGRGYEGRGGYN